MNGNKELNRIQSQGSQKAQELYKTLWSENELVKEEEEMDVKVARFGPKAFFWKLVLFANWICGILLTSASNCWLL